MKHKRFLEYDYSIENQRRDFCEWHLGRPRYYLWALDVDIPAVRQRVKAAEQHIAGLLLNEYFRQPHITLSLCGFPAGKPMREDEFTRLDLDAQLAALRQAAPKPFQIEIGGLSSFASAPYLCVSDPGEGILKLREKLILAAPIAPRDDYTPHVTVGLYAGVWPTTDIIPQLDSFLHSQPLMCRVDRISLMSYSASEIGGILTTVAEFDFNTAEMNWREPSPF